MLLHDALDVLAANANDSLVVLVWNMEGYRSRHLLLDKGQPLFHGLVAPAHDVNVEIVLVEAVEDDLNVACLAVSYGDWTPMDS